MEKLDVERNEEDLSKIYKLFILLFFIKDIFYILIYPQDIF